MHENGISNYEYLFANIIPWKPLKFLDIKFDLKKCIFYGKFELQAKLDDYFV